MTTELTATETRALESCRDTAAHGVRMNATGIDIDPFKLRVVVELVDRLLAADADDSGAPASPERPSSVPTDEFQADIRMHDASYNLGRKHTAILVEAELERYDRAAVTVGGISSTPLAIRVDEFVPRIRRTLTAKVTRVQ